MLLKLKASTSSLSWTRQSLVIGVDDESEIKDNVTWPWSYCTIRGPGLSELKYALGQRQTRMSAATILKDVLNSIKASRLKPELGLIGSLTASLC